MKKIIIFCLFCTSGFSQQIKIVGFVNNTITSLDSSFIEVDLCTYNNIDNIRSVSFEKDILQDVVIDEMYYLFSEDLKYGVLVNTSKDLSCNTYIHYDNIPLKIKYKP